MHVLSHVVPGGPAERVYVRKRRGFVREAIKHGAALVPVYVFGTTRAYTVLGVSDTDKQASSIARTLAGISRKLQSSMVIFYGRLYLSMPYR